MPISKGVEGVKVYKPCAHNAKAGATSEMCKRLSSIPAYARKCEGSKCKCPWRASNTVGADPEAGLPATSDALVEQGVRLTNDLRTPVSGGAPGKTGNDPPRNAARQLVELAERRRAEEAAQKEGSAKEPDQVPSPEGTKASHGEESALWRLVVKRVKAALAASTLVSVESKEIRPMPGQPRTFFNEAALHRLRQSIEEVGQIQAGIIRRRHPPLKDGEPEYELLDGERRWRAISQLAGVRYRAQLVVIDDEAAPFMVAAIANFNKENHTPLEVADAMHRLIEGDLKMPIREVAPLFGFSEMWAGQIYSLNRLHEDLRPLMDPDLPSHERLPVTTAIQVSKLEPSLQVEFVSKVVEEKIPATQVRRAVVKYGEKQGSPVRTRQVKPARVLANVVRKVGEARRVAGDLVQRLEELEEANIHFPADSQERYKVVAELDEILKNITRARDMVT